MTRRRTRRRAAFYISPLYLLALSPLVLEASAIWPFPPKRFNGNSLLGAGPLGVDDEDRIIAFGDFNGDQFLDLLALSSDQQELAIYLWNHDSYGFVKSSNFRHPQKVYNAVPGDFTQDGKLDILVMSQDQGGARDRLGVQLYVGLPQGGFDLHPVAAPSASLAQPIPMDITGDLQIDLFGTTPDDTDMFKVWRNVWNSSQADSPIFELTDPKINGVQCVLSNPHSNAAVDLNGDCLADIFLVCNDGNTGNQFFQIWVNNKDNGFALATSRSLPSGTQSITFGDIDRDGTIDMLFVTCNSVSRSTGIGSGCKLNIAYNKQVPTCSTATGRSVRDGKLVCRSPDDLCVADPNFQFDLRDASDNADFVSIPVSSLFSASGSGSYLLVQDTTHDPPLPVPIKLGDINQDGFPDFLAIVASGASSRAERTPSIAYSVQCGKDVPGCSANGARHRGWKVSGKGEEILAEVKDARGIAFLDMDEDGTLDIMVQRTGDQGEGKLLFVQNNFYYDAFFLKAIVLNGACGGGGGLCTAPNGTRYHPYGVSYSGATYKYTVLDTSGRRSAAEVGQLPQTAYHALLTPYSYFGLGRTNNYIENLFVGSTKHSEQHYIDMEGVIPNSKVVIIPPIEDGAWRKELYLRPGDWIPWVTLTVVIATVILAIIVFVLHLSEKREDELERRRASHHINFDAL